MLETKGFVMPPAPTKGQCEPERHGIRATQRLYFKHVVVDHKLPPDPRAPLTAEEWRSASRYRDWRDRNRYVQTRLALRILLGNIQGSGPRQVALRTGPQGKPEVSEGSEPLAFSVSHSGDDSLIAVARGCPIGIDIERDSPLVDTELVARHCLTRRERSVFRTMTPDERRRHFFAIWTAKEAYVKGLGLGFTLDLLAFEVRSFADGLWVFDSMRPEPRWRVYSFQLGRALVGAVALPPHPGHCGPEGCA